MLHEPKCATCGKPSTCFDADDHFCRECCPTCVANWGAPPVESWWSRAKKRVKPWLIWAAAMGPVAALIAERIAHLFGICLGMH